MFCHQNSTDLQYRQIASRTFALNNISLIYWRLKNNPLWGKLTWSRWQKLQHIFKHRKRQWVDFVPGKYHPPLKILLIYNWVVLKIKWSYSMLNCVRLRALVNKKVNSCPERSSPAVTLVKKTTDDDFLKIRQNNWTKISDNVYPMHPDIPTISDIKGLHEIHACFSPVKCSGQ